MSTNTYQTSDKSCHGSWNLKHVATQCHKTAIHLQIMLGCMATCTCRCSGCLQSKFKRAMQISGVPNRASTFAELTFLTAGWLPSIVWWLGWRLGFTGGVGAQAGCHFDWHLPAMTCMQQRIIWTCLSSCKLNDCLQANANYKLVSLLNPTWCTWAHAIQNPMAMSYIPQTKSYYLKVSKWSAKRHLNGDMRAAFPSIQQ